MAHSEIGASSYHRWGQCPGSVNLSRGLQKTTSIYAELGTEAHSLAERLLKCDPTLDLADYDDDMVEAVMVYVEAFQEACRGCTFFKVEEKFDLTHLFPDLYGTADGVIYHAETKTLEVWDYKNGQGVVVEADGNVQLLYYALGALLKNKVPCEWVKIVICQPNAFHPNGAIRSWTVPSADLIDFMADLVEDAEKTKDSNAPLASGDHCRFCPAAPICPLMEDMAISSAQEEFSPALKYDPEKLGMILGRLGAIESWVKAVRGFAQAEVERGFEIPGFKLVDRRANRKWFQDAENTEAQLLHQFGLTYMEVHQTPKLLSPAQIEKLLDKDQKKALEAMVTKQSSGKTLVPETDKRITAKSSVEADFTVITE